MARLDAERVIELLGLEPHPREGGWFRETYRSAESFEPGCAGSGARSVGTAIYYLLTPTTVSAPHRLPGDEIFHFYLGLTRNCAFRSPCPHRSRRWPARRRPRRTRAPSGWSCRGTRRRAGWS